MLIVILTTGIASACGGATTVETFTQVRTALPSEEAGNASSGRPAISADGRFVAFKSGATNLVLGAANGSISIYMKNTETGVTALVSSDAEDAQGKGDSNDPAVSADGQYIVFDSGSSDLVPGDTNNVCLNPAGANVNCADIFLKDSDSGVISRVSTDSQGGQANGASGSPSIAADGRYVAFRSAAANLVPGDGGGKTDIFLKDTSGGSVKRISTDMAGNEADGDSDKPAISADGRFIAFSSDATNLVPDDTNGQVDVFLKDAQTGAISLISTNAAGEQGDEANGFTSLAISADGRYVAFDSRSTNMVPDDTNQKADIFLKDTQTGQITPISADPSGQLGLEDSYSSVSLSADGRLVAFSSDAPNLVAGDTNNKRDVFLKNTATGAVTIISADAAGAQASGKSDNPSISADGRLVAFESDAANLAPSGSRGKTEIYLKDLETDEVRRISSSSTQD